MSSTYTAYLNSISNSLGYYYLIVTLPAGIVFNLVSIYIYSRPLLNRKTNTGFLYAWLCIINLLSIMQYTFITKSTLLFGYRVSLACGLSNYLRRGIFNLVSWMQVVISFDRFVSVFYPIKGHIMSKKVN